MKCVLPCYWNSFCFISLEETTVWVKRSGFCKQVRVIDDVTCSKVPFLQFLWMILISEGSLNGAHDALKRFQTFWRTEQHESAPYIIASARKSRTLFTELVLLFVSSFREITLLWNQITEIMNQNIVETFKSIWNRENINQRLKLIVEVENDLLKDPEMNEWQSVTISNRFHDVT